MNKENIIDGDIFEEIESNTLYSYNYFNLLIDCSIIYDQHKII